MDKAKRKLATFRLGKNEKWILKEMLYKNSLNKNYVITQLFGWDWRPTMGGKGIDWPAVREQNNAFVKYNNTRNSLLRKGLIFCRKYGHKMGEEIFLTPEGKEVAEAICKH